MSVTNGTVSVIDIPITGKFLSWQYHFFCRLARYIDENRFFRLIFNSSLFSLCSNVEQYKNIFFPLRGSISPLTGSGYALKPITPLLIIIIFHLPVAVIVGLKVQHVRAARGQG